MIALINGTDRYFYSYVFALMKNESRVLAVIFDAVNDIFQLSDVYESKYSLNRKVSIIDYDTDGFIERSEIALASFTATECCGYDWLLNNTDLLNAIEQNAPVDKKYTGMARELNSSIDLDKWHEIESDKEINELQSMAGGFHDSYLADIDYVRADADSQHKTKIRVTFELYNNYDLMLEFEGNIAIRYEFCTGANYIYLASVILGKDYIYWVEGSDDYELRDINENSDYFAAKKLRWKIIPKTK